MKALLLHQNIDTELYPWITMIKKNPTFAEVKQALEENHWAHTHRIAILAAFNNSYFCPGKDSLIKYVMAWYNKLVNTGFFLASDALYRVKLHLLAEVVGQLPANTFDEFNSCVKQIQLWQTKMDQDSLNRE